MKISRRKSVWVVEDDSGNTVAVKASEQAAKAFAAAFIPRLAVEETDESRRADLERRRLKAQALHRNDDRMKELLREEHLLKHGGDASELSSLRAERKALIGAYGANAQRHPMATMIGGLNPAAQRLNSVRNQIERLEAKKRKPQAELTPLFVRSRHSPKYGLLYKARFNNIEGKIGIASDGKYYVVSLNGDEIAHDLKKLSDARKAFEKHTK
jgi:hypothetical protein